MTFYDKIIIIMCFMLIPIAYSAAYEEMSEDYTNIEWFDSDLLMLTATYYGIGLVLTLVILAVIYLIGNIAI